MPHETHKVAVVIFCEAAGADERDAAYGAQLAIMDTLRRNAGTDPEAQAKVGSARVPMCSHCGASTGVDAAGKVPKHVVGERFYPDPDPNDPSYRPDACAGTGLDPRPDTHPVVGFTRSDGMPIYARIHDAMEAGMALGNGYLWAGVTHKAFRR